MLTVMKILINNLYYKNKLKTKIYVTELIKRRDVVHKYLYSFQLLSI